MSHHTHDHPEAEGHGHPHSRGEGEGEGFFDKVKEFFTGPADRTHEESLADDVVVDDEARGDGGRDDAVSDEGRDDRGLSENDLVAGDVHTPTADQGWEGDSATAADAPITDSVADSTESVDSTDSGWDGSDEPPELTMHDNDAVAAYSDDSSADDTDDGGSGDGDSGDGGSDYESRHGNGVDDSGVLADAPREGSAEWSDDEPASEVTESDDSEDGAQSASQDDVGAEAGEEEERARREEEFAREHDPSTHDVEAGEEFRQPGDWTAEEHGGPQVQEPDGTLHVPGEDSPEGSWGDGAGEAGESGPDDVRDGGHGWGSAAPIEGGAMPLGHPVKAWHDTMTFVMPGEDGYEGSDAHEWFVDGDAAQNAGFRHAHSG